MDTQIEAGRKAVDAYRKAHAKLHEKGWRKGISEEHTPLLDKLERAIKGQGFSSLSSFWVESSKYCLVEAKNAISLHDVYRDRQDLAMLGKQKKYNGVELKTIAEGRELVIDGKMPAVMSTSVAEHFSMMTAVKECPDNARVFIGGLGLGVILMYLASSGKAKEVTVCEIDDRVIYLLGNRITEYLDMRIEIIAGDAFEEIGRTGKFDWIYIDLTDGASPQIEKLARSALTNNGIYTPYDPTAWEMWK